jgi:predicted nucleic acid-binding protein
LFQLHNLMLHHATPRVHQQQRAYAIINSRKRKSKSSHHSHSKNQRYTQTTLQQALHAYTTICKTRQQTHKSIRQVGTDYGIPNTTLRRYIYTTKHQYSIVPTTTTNHHHDTSTEHKYHDNNNDTHNTIDSSLVLLHQQNVSVANPTIQLKKIGRPTHFSHQDELLLVHYIEEMATINLPLSKQDVIKTASEFTTQLGIELKGKTPLLAHKWWIGIYTHTCTFHTHAHTCPYIHVTHDLHTCILYLCLM